jgi:hypothetical protein
MRNSVLYLIIVMVLVLTINVSADSPYSDPELDKVYKDSLVWLKNQIVPNDIVNNPTPDRRKMILSYKIPENDPNYKYLAKRSFTYDNAVAAIAFTMAGKYRDAEFILNTLSRLVREDGSLWFSYNTHNSWPDENDHEGAMVRTGALAWAGYALSYYVSIRNEEDENFYKNDVAGRRYIAAAEKIADYLITMQVKDKKDARYGLVTGGRGTYKIEYSEENKRINEIYNYDSVGWVSVEHNIDTYFFFKSISLVNGKKYYFNKGELVKKSILKSFWDRKSGQFFRGIKVDGKKDLALPLDGASWGALFLSSIGAEGKMNRSLDFIDKNFSTESEFFKGYAPYFDEYVYEDEKLNSHIFDSNKKTKWKDINVVWSEGSLGVAAAWIKAGNMDKGLEIIKNTSAMSVDGGLIYSSENLPYLFSDYPSVAGSGWFIIASELYRDPENIFWSE